MPIYCKIINVRSVLDVPNESTQHGLQIQQFADNGGSPNQRWALLPLPNTLNGFEIQSAVPNPPDQGLLLDADSSGTTEGTPDIQFVRTNKPNQWWTFEPVDQKMGYSSFGHSTPTIRSFWAWLVPQPGTGHSSSFSKWGG